MTHSSEKNFAKGIARAIDGDTIEINKEKIRFGGINSPERNEVGYKLAKDKLTEKIKNTTLVCMREKNKDRYSRTVAECFVNGESLSKFLVSKGYAFAYRKYSKKFIKDERFAKKNRLGLWSMKFIFPWEFRKL